MSDIIEQRDFSTWPELVAYLKANDTNGKIYRGQSNEYRLKNATINGNLKINLEYEFLRWALISSFDRYYYRFYNFETFLWQQLEDNNFRNQYGRHDFREIFYLKDCTQLERIYYLQHYGVPTCFLDFSQKPLVALYFAIVHVRANNIYTPDQNDNPGLHPFNAYISLYELNHLRISELLNIKYIGKDFTYQTYSKYKVKIGHLAFDITPLCKCESNTLNENLERQKGCFVLYDNGSKNISLVKRLSDLMLYANVENETLIKEYTLPYNAIFEKHDFEDLKNVTLFKYLDLSDISGRTLFNDIQGLKYDLNFFHH